MGTSRLQLYNDALQLCGEPRLSSLSENRRARYELDTVWQGADSQGGWINSVLEQGQWAFAARTIQIDADPDVAPEFGYTNAFTRPDDWIATMALCSDERLTQPLLRYRDENDFIWADIDPLYWKYVSNDADYGGDLGRWPQSFVDYAAAYGASKVVLALTSDKQRWEMIMKPRTGILDMRLATAKNKAAQRQPTMMQHEGSWNRSRRGRGGTRGRNDGGNPNEFTG